MTEDLANLHPAADVIVSLDYTRGWWAFAEGHHLHRYWEDKQLCHVGTLMAPSPDVHKLLCPDGRYLLIKFLSRDCQFIDGEQPKHEPAQEQNNTMATAPLKKGAAKPAAQVKPAKAPAKSAVAPATGAAKPAKVTRTVFKDMSIAKILDKLTADGHIEELGAKAKKFFVELIESGVSVNKTTKEVYPWLPNRFKAHATDCYKA